MNKLLRKIHFWFLWKALEDKLDKTLKGDPMAYPMYVLIEFSKPKIKADYLAGMSMQEALTKTLEDADKQRARTIHKDEARTKMLTNMTFDEMNVYAARVEAWKIRMAVIAIENKVADSNYITL